MEDKVETWEKIARDGSAGPKLQRGGCSRDYLHQELAAG